LKKTPLIASLLVIVLLASVAVTWTFYNTGSKPNNAGSIDTLVIGTTEKISNINVGGDLDTYRDCMLTESLIRLDSTGAYVPALAKSWETQDAQRWVFHLRNDATWHDGVPVTSYDIKFSLEYLPAKLGGSNWAVINSVEAPDNETVVINLKYAKANFLVNLLELRTVPMHIFENIDDPEAYNNANATIGCGPYEFVSFDEAAGTLIVKAYENYYGGIPAAKTIQFKFFSNEETMVMALQSGEVDTTWKYSGGVSYTYVDSLQADSDLSILRIKNVGVPNVLWFNLKNTAFSDVQVREAISYAINYNELVTLFTSGYGTNPKAGFIPAGSYNYYDGTRTLTLNITYAEELLYNAGYVDVDNDGYRETSTGANFQPDIKMKNDAESIRLGEMMKKYLNAIGIDVTISSLDSGSYWDYIDGGNYEMFVTRTTPWGMMMDSGYVTGYFDARSGRGNGWTNLLDPEFQAIADKLLNTTDTAQVKQLSTDLQVFYADQLPAVSLYWNDYIQPYNNKYVGYVASPTNGILSYETYFGLHPGST
jgi:peptide/nickel transport system substrate-binding protein